MVDGACHGICYGTVQFNVKAGEQVILGMRATTVGIGRVTPPPLPSTDRPPSPSLTLEERWVGGSLQLDLRAVDRIYWASSLPCSGGGGAVLTLAEQRPSLERSLLVLAI